MKAEKFYPLALKNMKNGVEEKLKILQELYKSDFLQPFPYQDCHKLISQNNSELKDFIPSLDLFCSEVAGYCSWGKRIVSWSVEKIETVESQMRNSLFDRFPQYINLKSKITEQETPTLYNQLLIYDLMRLTLVDILSEMKTGRLSQTMETAQLPLAS